MGLASEFNYLEELAHSTDVNLEMTLKENTFAVVAQDKSGDYVFGTEIPCEHGIVEKTFVHEWFRREFWIRNRYKRWGDQLGIGDLLKLENEGVFQSLVSNPSDPPLSHTSSDAWLSLSNLQESCVVLSGFPRSSRNVRTARFRTGPSNGSREERIAEAKMIKQEFDKDGMWRTPSGESVSPDERFIDWYERQSLDWDFYDNTKLIAGYSRAKSGKRVRMNQAAVVFGIVTTNDWRYDEDKNRLSAFESARLAIWETKEVKKAHFDASFCSEAKVLSNSKDETEGGCSPKDYFIFWQLGVARKFWKNPRAIIHLNEKQLATIPDLMDISIRQALAGPAAKDFIDGDKHSWVGKKVAEFAVFLFKKHLYADYQKLFHQEPGSEEFSSEPEFVFENASYSEYIDSERQGLECDEVLEALRKFDQQDQLLIMHSFGLDGHDVLSQQEVSDLLGIPDLDEIENRKNSIMSRLKAIIARPKK